MRSLVKWITVLGSTGSIGQNTLKVVYQNLNDFCVYALTGHSSINLLFKQCLNFFPKYAVVSTASLAKILQTNLKKNGSNTEVLYGTEALISVVSSECVDLVMAAIVGIAGLKPTFAAIKSNKTVLLANKEVLVSAGKIFMEAVAKSSSTLLPVDSEHNAIFQCLLNGQSDLESIEKIILTASGGPFRKKTLDKLHNVTPEEACAHPTWKMGKKISVDSSTMMNKALEVIEVYWLFSIPVDKIEVIIHPQSIVHSMVKYCDGSYLAQLGSPDMKTPISYSMYYPRRHKVEVSKLDWTKTALTFEKLDLNRFKAISIAYNILKLKDYAASIILNAANEVLVEAFLMKRIQYSKIMEYIDYTLKNLNFANIKYIEDVIYIDKETRTFVNDNLLK